MKKLAFVASMLFAVPAFAQAPAAKPATPAPAAKPATPPAATPAAPAAPAAKDAKPAMPAPPPAAPEVKATMRQLVRAGTAQIGIGELRRIDVPATLLWGREDRFVGVELAERASAGLGWPLHVVEDAGHVPHIERPAAFCEALGDAIGTEAR